MAGGPWIDDTVMSMMLRGASGLVFGMAGAVSAYFNDIINGRLTFSAVRLVMLMVIGGTLGTVATTVAPEYGIHPAVASGIACAVAAGHDYIFASIAWFIQKWTTK